MKNKSLHLAALLVLTINNFTSTVDTDGTVYPDETNEEIKNLSNQAIKEKVCAILAVLKCTFYKLDAILNQIDDGNQLNCNQDNCHKKKTTCRTKNHSQYTIEKTKPRCFH